MDVSETAMWIERVFSKFDYKILEFFHHLHSSESGVFFDDFFKFITSLGDGGMIYIVLSVVFLVFGKTRKLGIAMVLSLIIGALSTNVILKPLIERPRPYADEASIFYQWWKDVGYPAEHDIYSFPSGHATSVFATMTALFMLSNKKYRFLAYVFAILMGISRNYLFVHYPSDVLGGAIVGILSGVIAVYMVKLIYKYKRENIKVCVSNSKLGTYIQEKNRERHYCEL